METEITLAPQISIPPELASLIKRCYQEKPAKEDVARLQKELAARPGLWRAVIDFGVVVQQMTIDKLRLPMAATAAVKADLAEMQNALGYESAPELERMLIENVLTTWLTLHWAEIGHAQHAAVSSIEISEYWEKVLSSAQLRHLRACETLARVRKLGRNTPAIQVNQQVNIAGDFVKG